MRTYKRAIRASCAEYVDPFEDAPFYCALRRIGGFRYVDAKNVANGNFLFEKDCWLSVYAFDHPATSKDVSSRDALLVYGHDLQAGRSRFFVGGKIKNTLERMLQNAVSAMRQHEANAKESARRDEEERRSNLVERIERTMT